MQTTCRACSGTKVIIKQYCGECKGKGKMIMRKKVVVPVPAGNYKFLFCFINKVLSEEPTEIFSVTNSHYCMNTHVTQY